MPRIPPLRRQMKKDQEFNVFLGYMKFEVSQGCMRLLSQNQNQPRKSKIENTHTKMANK